MARHVYNPSRYEYLPSDKPNVVIADPYDGRGKRRKVNARIAKFNGKKIIAYKKALHMDSSASKYYGDVKYCLVTLEIPANAVRYQPKNNKCRASRAKVIAINEMSFEGTVLDAQLTQAKARHDRKFIYEVGKVVKPTRKFDKMFKHECCSGIHFFLTEEEAAKYYL
jgi:hypothetical protein